MRVIGTRRRPEPMANVAEVLPAGRTPEVLAQSDFLLLLLPATTDTENLIDAAARPHEAHRLAAHSGRGHLIMTTT
jgi:phosphoglycerate dehydrogenase-like enzyme